MLWPFFVFEYPSSSGVSNKWRTCAQNCLWLVVLRSWRSFCHLRWAWAALNWKCKAGHLMRPFILQSVQQRIKISVWEQGETTQLVNNVRISPTNDAMRCLLCSGCASALKPEMGRGWSLGHSPSLEELCVPVMSFHIPFESSDQQTTAETVSFCFGTALFDRC